MADNVICEVTYTVHQSTEHLGGGKTVVARIDSQPGQPVLHWGSMPTQIVLRSEEALPPLGAKLTLRLELV